MLSGLLVVACAAGIRRALRPGRGRTRGALLFAGYGVGLILGGLFTPDPSFGYPVGAPAGYAAATSWHALIHQFAFNAAFISLVAATFVFTRRSFGRGETRWGRLAPDHRDRALPPDHGRRRHRLEAVLLVITSGWVSALSGRLPR